jgi:hypothetical protein
MTIINSQTGMASEIGQIVDKEDRQQWDDDAQFFHRIHLVHPENSVRSSNMKSNFVPDSLFDF